MAHVGEELALRPVRRLGRLARLARVLLGALSIGHVGIGGHEPAARHRVAPGLEHGAIRALPLEPVGLELPGDCDTLLDQRLGVARPVFSALGVVADNVRVGRIEPGHVLGKLQQVEKALVPGDHAQVAVDGEEALVDALERRVKDGRPRGELGLPVAELVQDALEVGRHAVERLHGGGDLHELGRRHAHGEIPAPEAGRALGECTDGREAAAHDRVRRGEERDQQERGHGDRGAHLCPEVRLERHRGRCHREHRVDDGGGGDGKAGLGHVNRHQAAEPGGDVRHGRARRRRVEDERVPILFVKSHVAPHQVDVQVVERLLGAGQVADHQRVQQQRNRRGAEPLGLDGHPLVRGADALVEAHREAGEHHRDDGDAGQPQQDGLEPDLHCPMSRYTRRTPS